MAKAEMDIAVTLTGFATVRPGDTLIVALGRKSMTLDDADRYKAKLREMLPGLSDVVVLCDVSALAAYRPEVATDAR